MKSVPSIKASVHARLASSDQRQRTSARRTRFSLGQAAATTNSETTALPTPEHLAASVHDLWEKEDLGRLTGQFSAAVPSQGVVIVRIRQ